MIYRVERDSADMRESAPSTRRLAIAALAVWALAAVGLGALAGGDDPLGWVGALAFMALVCGGLAAVGVQFGEIAFGVGLLLAGGAWMLYCGIISLWLGLGWGTGDVFAEPYVVELGVDLKALAFFGAFTSLGLIPLSVGVSFIFGVGPLAKRVTEPEPKKGPSRRAALAVGVEALLVMAILVVAAFVVRTMLHEDGSFMSSVSNAPGP